MADRDKLIAKIRALTAKTVSAGCTEAEALAAAEKAADLMREHAVSEVLLDMGKSSIGVKFNIRSPKGKLCAAVAHVTNCVVIHSKDGREQTVYYVGYAPGPEIACYLHDVVQRAVETAVKEFRAGRFYRARRSDKTKRKAVADFTDGMVSGLCYRLIRMFRETISAERRAKADQAAAEMFPAARSVKQKEGKTRFREAASAGDRAADRVNLARGVREGQVAGLLGKAGS